MRDACAAITASLDIVRRHFFPPRPDRQTDIRPDVSDAQCPNMKFAAAGGLDGTLQGFYKLPADL